jgi:hypothetical protein
MNSVDMNWRQVSRIAQEMEGIVSQMRTTRDRLQHSTVGMQSYTQGDVYVALELKRDMVVASIDDIIKETDVLIKRLCDDSEFVKRAMAQFTEGGKR